MQNSKDAREFHKPVLVSEVLVGLKADDLAHSNKQVCFVDATVGLGGHASEFVKRGIFTIGIDADTDTLKLAEEVLSEACPIPHHKKGAGCFKLLHGNFSKVDALVREVYSGAVTGILFDLGISSMQLDATGRGFSFRDVNSPLDMRLDKETQEVKASDLLLLLDKRKLTELFSQVIPRGRAARIASRVVEERSKKAISTVSDFLEIVKPIVYRRGKINEATLPFLALRMAVNSEVTNLGQALPRAYELLSEGGRLAVISFHSGEDRIVKHFFQETEARGRGEIITRKPVIPSGEEISENPRARSAKMRVIKK
jgi:16S rRNA (cytosine1402-N4)-methyltransferase